MSEKVIAAQPAKASAASSDILKNRRNKKMVETVFEAIFIICALVAVISVVVITAT